MSLEWSAHDRRTQSHEKRRIGYNAPRLRFIIAARLSFLRSLVVLIPFGLSDCGALMRSCLCSALIVSWTCCFPLGVFAADADQTIEVSSPGNQIKVKFEPDERGRPGSVENLFSPEDHDVVGDCF
jgi:hypothetical protein